MHTLVAMRYAIQEAQRGPPVEAVNALPGPHHGFLHRIFGFEARAEHAVAVAGQFPAVHLQLSLRAAVVAGQSGVPVGRQRNPQ
jgi:hypothetical protein